MKFATLITFTEQGMQNIGDTTHRASAFSEQAKKAGLEISELLWLSGRYDGLLIYEAPDLETASAAMLRLSKAGNVKTETFAAFNAVEMNSILERV